MVFCQVMVAKKKLKANILRRKKIQEKKLTVEICNTLLTFSFSMRTVMEGFPQHFDGLPPSQ
jgi:hypothetical protein